MTRPSASGAELPIVNRTRNAAKIVGKAGDRIGERDIAEAAAVLVELYEALEGFNLKERDIVSGTADSLTIRVSLDTIRKAAAVLERARQ
jgi:hypothetical protein